MDKLIPDKLKKQNEKSVVIYKKTDNFILLIFVRMNNSEVTTLGGGCFWCMEAIFNQVKGVIGCISGYSGGNTVNPNYEDVKTGRTGHAEVVQIKYNPEIISFQEILIIFFSVHDPTTLNRQGDDIGTQYRSVILYHNDTQKSEAEKMIVKLTEENSFTHPIVTSIIPFENFYRAEDYHQEYFKKNPFSGYCNHVIKPKMNKFRKIFTEKVKE